MKDSEKTKKLIARFVEYFQKSLDAIQVLTCEKALSSHERVFKGTLYMTWIDAITRSVYPRKDNRDRFVSFINRFGTWPDGERVSLPHLQRVLDLCPDPAFEKLRQFAQQRLSSWRHFFPVPLSKDPAFEEVNKIWPKSDNYKQPIDGVKAESLKHTSLLYSYRNSLIHEFRTLGYGVEFEEETEPYYHLVETRSPGQTENAPENIKIELVYPLPFFHSLCSRSLERLKEYLSTNEIDPYNSYTFGSFWLEELN